MPSWSYQRETFMLKVNKSKSAIGVIALLLLVTLTPSASAGKPGSTPSLNGTLCKSFGGQWKAGKTGTCTISGSHRNERSFNISAGNTLVIAQSGTFINNATINNSGGGSITSSGTFINNAEVRIINFGTITNLSTSLIDNYGYIESRGFFKNSGNFINHGEFFSDLNTDLYINELLDGGIFTNRGVVNFINGPTSFDGTFNNYGTLNNFSRFNFQGATFNNYAYFANLSVVGLSLPGNTITNSGMISNLGSWFYALCVNNYGGILNGEPPAPVCP